MIEFKTINETLDFLENHKENLISLLNNMDESFINKINCAISATDKVITFIKEHNNESENFILFHVKRYCNIYI